MKDQKRFAALALSAVMVFSMAGSVSAAQKVESKDDLAGATIGVQLGTTGDLDASDYEKDGSTVERYSKGSEAVQALKAGQIDCVIIDSQPAQKFVENNDDLKILDEPFEEEEYAICLKKGNDELLDKINGALKELKEDGTIDSIMDNYIGEDAGKTPYESPEDVDRSNGTLVMATNAEFEPYEYHEGDDIVGIDADIAQAICDKLGYELKIEDMEFDSILPAVQSGKADFGAAGMTVTEDRKSSVDFTDTYADASQVIIVKKFMNNPMILANVKEDFYLNFIKDDRYLWLLDGLKTTLIITVFAVIVGLIIGFLVAIIRSAHDKSGSFKILNAICRVYLTVIRGTPTMIQLLIMNFVIFGAVSINKIIVGGLAFGINSGAYVAEIVRSGIMSIDQGQTEAGRSLGLNFSQTMRLIIIPQAFKNVLPALVNEFIVLIKETSIIGYIGMMDLTKGAMLIQSRTYNAFWPLMAAAAIYLVIVGILTWGMNKLERRLRTSER